MFKDSVKILPQRQILCLELLKTFSKEDIVGLTHFIACPHFNTDKYVIQLFEVLKKHGLVHLIYNDVQKNKIYESVFKHLPKPKDKLTKNESSLLSNKLNILMRLAEKYLAIEALNKEDVYHDDLLFGELLKRKQFLSFNRQIKKRQKKLSLQKIKNQEYYFHQYKINDILILYSELNDEQESNLFKKMLYYYDISFIITKLEVYLIILTLWRTSNDIDYDFSSLEAINKLIELPEYAKIPLIKLFKANIHLEKEQNIEAYYNMLTLLDKYSTKIPANSLLTFYVNASNYCGRQIEIGNIEYNKIIFDLYKIMHEKNLLTTEGNVSIYLLKNIISISCKNEEFEWATMIINYYKNFIPKVIRSQIYDFNTGIIAFYQKNYDVAHEKFIQVDKLNFTYDINARILILKCIYEKEKHYSEPTVQSFRSAERYFLNNSTLPTQTKIGLKNFIQILINLYRIRHKATKMTKQRLKEKLEQQKVNTDKQWLLEKIAEL